MSGSASDRGGRITELAEAGELVPVRIEGLAPPLCLWRAAQSGSHRPVAWRRRPLPATLAHPVGQGSALAAATPGVAYAAKLIPAPFDAVWDAASDLEHELPRLLTDVRSFEITSARGERMTARARGWLGQRARFDVVLRPGWCVMQSRFLIGGMAAVPEGDGTRFAFLGGLRLPGMRLIDPLFRRAARTLALRPIGRLEDRLQVR